jgi:hypothetical protein
MTNDEVKMIVCREISSATERQAPGGAATGDALEHYEHCDDLLRTSLASVARSVAGRLREGEGAEAALEDVDHICWCALTLVFVDSMRRGGRDADRLAKP